MCECVPERRLCWLAGAVIALDKLDQGRRDAALLLRQYVLNAGKYTRVHYARWQLHDEADACRSCRARCGMF